MKYSGRLLSLALTLLMLFSVCVPAWAETEKWDYELDTSPTEFTAWWPNVWGWAKPSVENGWDLNSPVLAHITEKTGVTMNIDMPVGSQNDLAGPIIASGQYPDMMIFDGYDNVYVNQMIEAGQLYAISDLVEEYAPRFWELTTQDLRAMHNGKDGKLWKYVGFEQDQDGAQALVDCGIAPTQGSNTEFVRADILKAFGKEDITTLDELTELLFFIRDNYPDLDAISIDESQTTSHPLTGSFYRHFGAIFGLHLSMTYPVDDQIQLVFKDPKYLEMIKWMNMLYREEVITDSMLTEDDQTHTEKMFAGRYGVIVNPVFDVYNTINLTLESNNGTDEMNYKAIGPSVKEGIPFKTEMYRSKGSFSVVVTKNAKQPDRIIRFLEYLLTDDGQTTITLGTEGNSWEMVDGEKVLLPEAAELIASDLQGYVTKYNVLGRWAPFAKVKYWSLYCDNFLTPVGEPRDENNKRLGGYVEDIWSQGFMQLRDCLPKGGDLDVAYGKITTAYKVASAKMIAAKSDEELMQHYNDFIAEIEALGSADIEAYFTQQYQSDKAQIQGT